MSYIPSADTLGTISQQDASAVNMTGGTGTNLAISLSSFSGTIALPTTIKTSSYTATSADGMIMCDATAGPMNLTLPPASNAGQLLIVKKFDVTANAVAVKRAGSDTIEGLTTRSLSAQYNSLMLIAGGAGVWYIIAST